MANALAGFDPDNFRTQIRNTMIMGLPQTIAERPTFYSPAVTEWPTHYPSGDPINFDDDGKPLDPSVRPVTHGGDVGIQVACAVEFKPTTGDTETIIGNFRDAAAVLTLLDTEYVIVAGCDTVDLGGVRYYINFIGPPLGLGPVTVYQLYCNPTGESNVLNPVTQPASDRLQLHAGNDAGHATVTGGLT